MKKSKLLLVFGGWATLSAGLFIAVISGNFAEEYFGADESARQIIQAAVMSGFVIPIILWLYNFHNNRAERSSYSLKSAYHIFSGLIIAWSFGIVIFLIMNFVGWINIIQWNSLHEWIAPFLFTLFVAFFYEALPEELAIRGLVYDVLRNNYSIWVSIFIQAIIFVLVAFTVNVLQVVTGMESVEILLLNSIQFILLFVFGIVLALLRELSGNIWISVGFHLGYLTLARYLFTPYELSQSSIIKYEDELVLMLGFTLSIAILLLSMIFILIILLKKKQSVEK